VPHRGVQEVAFHAGGQADRADAVRSGRQRPQDLEAVAAVQGQIEQQDVRVEVPHQLQRLAGAARSADHHEMGL
jgi:hypothetical protein